MCTCVHLCLCVFACLCSCWSHWKSAPPLVDAFKHSSAPSAAACSCSSSPLLFLRRLLLLLFPRHACASLSPCVAPPLCHHGDGGCVEGGIPEPCSAGQGFRGESVPSRSRTTAGFRRSDRTRPTRKPGGDWQRGSKQRGARWPQSSGSRAPPPGSGRPRRETARLDESGRPARSPPAGHQLSPDERFLERKFIIWIISNKVAVKRIWNINESTSVKRVTAPGLVQRCSLQPVCTRSLQHVWIWANTPGRCCYPLPPSSPSVLPPPAVRLN